MLGIYQSIGKKGSYKLPIKRCVGRWSSFPPMCIILLTLLNYASLLGGFVRRAELNVECFEISYETLESPGTQFRSITINSEMYNLDTFNI